MAGNLLTRYFMAGVGLVSPDLARSARPYWGRTRAPQEHHNSYSVRTAVRVIIYLALALAYVVLSVLQRRAFDVYCCFHEAGKLVLNSKEYM